MPDLKNKIQEDFKKALKEKDSSKVLVLRLILAAITIKEKEKRYKLNKKEIVLKEEELEKESQLTEEEIIEIILSEIKKRKESILKFQEGKRADLVEKEKAELEILQSYLPKQLSEEEVKKLAKETIEKLKARNLKELGRVMAELTPKTKGKADGSLVSKIVKELLER